MTPIEFFEELSTTIGWQGKRTYWDENKYGPRPSHYFVWRFSTRSFIDTDDEVDVETKTFRGSFFTKHGEETDSVREQAEALALENKLTVESNIFEDYEVDTGYNHFDIDFTFYKED